MSSDAPPEERPQQEPGDLEPGIVLYIVAAIVAMLVVVALLARLILESSGPTRNSPQTRQVGGQTRLESDPAAQLASFEQAKQTRLHTYGWVDPQHQFAHIPIEAAMHRLTERTPAPRNPP
jgi:hypothetical protein